MFDDIDDDDDDGKVCSGRWGSSSALDDESTSAGTPSELSGVMGSGGGTGSDVSFGLLDSDDGSQMIHAQLQWSGPHIPQYICSIPFSYLLGCIQR